MLNRITIMGRLTADPELRYTQNQVPVCSFSIACERDFTDSNGNRETDFFPVVAWRGTGEFVNKYFQKGSMIVVDGRLQIRDWTSKDGEKRRTAEIVAESVYFGERKAKSEQAPAEAPKFEELSDEEGELPF